MIKILEERQRGYQMKERELQHYANEQFYAWEKAKYGDNPCDYVLSDEDRLIWVAGFIRCYEMVKECV